MTTINCMFGNRPYALELETFDKNYGTGATDEEKQRAIGILKDLFEDPLFGHMGRRNDDAVNSMIALHVLGFYSKDYLEALCKRVEFPYYDYFEEHIERVADYLEYWGPSASGNEARAFGYMV